MKNLSTILASVSLAFNAAIDETLVEKVEALETKVEE